MLSSARGFIHKPALSDRKPQSEAVRITDLSRVLQLLQDPLSSSLKERQIFILKKVVKQCQRGFLLRDLADIFKIMNVCAERVSDHPEYARILCDLLQICSLPFVKEKASDEMNYAAVVTDCVSDGSASLVNRESYVARTSNYSVLKEFRRLREERSTGEPDASSEPPIHKPVTV